MRAVRISKHSESKRMFQSDFIEFFSKIPPWQPPVIFLPIIAWNLYRAVTLDLGLFWVALYFSAGLLIWTLMEYWAHRKLFHFYPTSRIGKRLIWILHGVHHDWPNDKMRLVFPPTLSLPLALLVWWGYGYLYSEVARYAAFSGTVFGYLAYDMIHYYTHHFVPRNRIGKFLRQYHLTHHFKEEDRRFGVSNPLWDYVFGTAPRRMASAESVGDSSAVGSR